MICTSHSIFTVTPTSSPNRTVIVTVSSSQSPDISISAISAIAGAVVLLVIIIITIVVLILCVSTRRKKNNTGKTPHHTTTTHTRNTSSGGPTGDYDDEPQVKAAQQHIAHTTTSFSVYDDIDTKPDKRNYIEQFADPIYEDMKKRKGKNTASSSSRSDLKEETEIHSETVDPSHLYATPDKSKKRKSKKLQEINELVQLYAQPDKTKKKDTESLEEQENEEQENEEQENEDVLQYESRADSAEEKVPQVPPFDPEILHSVVNK